MAVENGSRKTEMQPMQIESSGLREPGFCEKLWTLTKLYMAHYPIVTTILVFALITALMAVLLPSLKSPYVINRVTENYSNITLNYDFAAEKMDHWCLFARDDDKCDCPDFTAPEPGFGRNWKDAHKANVKAVEELATLVDDAHPLKVAFIGDDHVERMNGTLMGSVPTKRKDDLEGIGNWFRNEFTNDINGGMDAVALGIHGDSSANILWRIDNGELPEDLPVDIYWLWAGTSDLTHGYCSEQATILGLLKTAEILATRPDARVVIQGILPIGRTDGRLESDVKKGFLGIGGGGAHTLKQARDRYSFWSSVKRINEELRDFCTKHPHIMYFDVNALLVNKKSSTEQFNYNLMKDFRHLSLEGYKVVGKAIKEEIARIMQDENEGNDIIHKQLR